MTQNTNLNVSPYFDDFDEDKNYNKVLFKPGFPVQSRELTTLQSILQGQIEKFGQHFFKEGSIVIPGGVFYDNRYYAVRIDPTFLEIPVANYTKFLVDNKIEIQGEISGVKATVVNRLTRVESEDGFDTLYLKYSSSGSDGTTKQFQPGESLITLSDINFGSTTITANNSFARCILSEANRTGSSASLSEGVFFIRGYFVKVPSSTIILDQYTNTPSYKVGLQITEEIVTASSEYSDLYDNAQGFSNESAPGADRFCIKATLSKKSISDNNDLDFVEILRVEDGVVERLINRTEYNIFKDELARRTYDESGDYYVKPFSVDVRESLNDRIGNNGLYLPSQVTKNGNTPTDDIFTLLVSPGKAYVRGYEIDKQSTSSIDVPKPRTTRDKENISVPVKIGNNVQIENVYGSPKIGVTTTYTVELKDQRLAESGLTQGNVIGKARVYDYAQKNISGVGTSRYDVKLFDIQTFTNITVGFALTASANSYVRGKFSGASGHIVTGITGATAFDLTDVNGQFQINEPIEIDGLTVGRNITVVRDFDFTDVKSMGRTVGVTTFAANLSLTKEKFVFPSGTELNINANGNVTGSSISDFRAYLKVGDTIAYGVPSLTTPVFNRVASFANNGATVVVAGIHTEAGVNTGAVTGSSPTDARVVVPVLENADAAGKVIHLPNKNVSSINLNDSNYIVRKQISKNVTSNTFTFQLSDLGDNDLFLEPFTESNYVLTWETGGKELIRESQVTISADLKEISIVALSQTGNATLSITCKRSKLSSKSKTISRCERITLSRSKNPGAGVGSTTFDDGLTFSSVYGTRVQDESISLNVPDVSRVLAIFESNDNQDPDLPSITVSNGSDTFTNNVIVGEQFIGAESGAIGRVVNVVSGTELTFVYENDRRFELSEQISLSTSGITAILTTILLGDRNISSSFSFDDGQREEFCDYSRINRNANQPEPTGRLTVIFDRYASDESTGTIESINSYTNIDYTNDIPSFNKKRVSDFIDLRPRVNTYDPATEKSPFAFDSRVFTSSKSESLVTNKTIVLDYSYYLGRVDRLYLTKNGIFEVKQGEPSEYPKAPVANSEGFEVAVIAMQPYVFDATYDCRLRTIPHKRFTMRDIGSIENRVKNLEEFTTLSLLETDTKNLSIKDPNTGLDKFKSGFFVDNFRTNNLSGESAYDIDLVRGECRPRSTERNIALQFETKTTEADPVNADYRWAEDFADANVTRNGPGLTLNFEEVNFVEQPLATRTENLNPFHIALYAGSIELNPASDFWIEEVVLPTPDIINIDSAFNGMANLLGVEDRENGGMSTGFWNSVETTWTGTEVLGTNVDEENILDRQNIFNGIERANGGGVPIRQVTRNNVTVEQLVTDTVRTTGIDREFGFNLTASEELVSLGERVVGVDILHNCRSRNIEVIGRRLKPNTRYYVFMEDIDMNEYAFPKTIGINMVRGAFGTGDIVDSVGGYVADKASIRLRLATSDHEEGPFNSPLRRRPNVSSYSGTSTELNVDLPGLASQTRPDHLGYLKEGMVLVNLSGTAEATVTNIALVSDSKGDLRFSLHIPDPTIASNPKFTTGASTIRLTTVATNPTNLDPGESSAETNYFASGYAKNVEEQTLSIKTPQVERQQIGSDQPITVITEEQRVEVVDRVEENVGAWYDPLAQSFLVETDEKSDGIFITGGDLFFKTKDNVVPVTVQIRTMRDGSPTTTIVPFGQVNIEPADILTSDDGSVATNFKFDTPVYLQSGYEYALTLVAPTEKYTTFITRMGEEDLLLRSVYNRQPYLGSLFKSQNQSTWTPSQLEDLKFTLKKAKFVTNTITSTLFYNTELPVGTIKKSNPVTAYSKRQFISIGATSTTFVQGNEIRQGNNNGKIFATGGPVNSGAAGLDATSAGIGLTDGTFVGIGFSTLTGFGQGVVGTVVIASGAVDSISVTNSGSGYAVGDLLLANPIGATGSGVRATVANVTNTSLLVVDNVKENFVTGTGFTYYNSAGIAKTMDAPTSISNDPIRDGSTMLFDHRNHGMHASTNKLRVYNVQSDVKETTLTAAIDDDTAIIKVADGTNFTTFEGTAVGAGHTGYLKIDGEIISYNTISGNDITIASRVVDSSQKSNHAQYSNVFKYEFNSVSLLKINKEHNIDPREKTFDSYHVKIADTSKTFGITKSGGGDNVQVSQNIPFEYINPQFNLVSPSGTSISARVKTTSGTSISGNEASFQDLGFENITLNKLNRLDSPRMIASKINESGLLGGNKSFALELLMQTSNPDVSPMVDLDTANVIAVSNLINDKVTDYEIDSRVKISGSDPNSALYVTRKIDLEFASNSLFVQFDAHREADADIRVFYKLFRKDGNDAAQVYVPFNTDGSPDKVVNPNETENGFSEYKFTAENTPQFNGFMIKVIMSSTNQAHAPRIKNFRSIALRAFSTDE